MTARLRSVFMTPFESSHSRSALRICSEYGIPSRSLRASMPSRRSLSGRKVTTRSVGDMGAICNTRYTLLSSPGARPSRLPVPFRCRRRRQPSLAVERGDRLADGRRMEIEPPTEIGERAPLTGHVVVVRGRRQDDALLVGEFLGRDPASFERCALLVPLRPRTRLDRCAQTSARRS